MEQIRIVAAFITGFLGLLFLIGFFRAFRERIYLALLGLAFITLAARMLVVRPELTWLKWTLVALSGVFFLGAVLFAVLQTLAQMRLIQERRKGLEAEMWAYLEQLKKRTAQTEEKTDEP